jgi:hypothetical protein
MTRFWKTAVFVVLALLLVTSVWLYVRNKLVTPSNEPAITLSDLKTEPPPMPGEPPQIIFLEPNMSSTERRAFLAEDYKILRSVTELPEGIVKDFTVKGETRIAMADPGEKFEATDVISDPTLPRRRLIFAGVAGDRAFVHYELGGMGKSFVIEFFRLKSPEIAAGAWHGFCNGPARGLDDLRQRISDGRCQ